MKEFIVKHPFWAFLIVGRICTCLEVLIRNQRPEANFRNVCGEVVRCVEDEVRNSSKKPMGFHFNKEEA